MGKESRIMTNKTRSILKLKSTEQCMFCNKTINSKQVDKCFNRGMNWTGLYPASDKALDCQFFREKLEEDKAKLYFESTLEYEGPANDPLRKKTKPK